MLFGQRSIAKTSHIPNRIMLSIKSDPVRYRLEYPIIKIRCQDLGQSKICFP